MKVEKRQELSKRPHSAMREALMNLKPDQQLRIKTAAEFAAFCSDRAYFKRCYPSKRFHQAVCGTDMVLTVSERKAKSPNEAAEKSK